MYISYETVKTLNKTITINGTNIDVEVCIIVSQDREPEIGFSFDFGSTEENNKYLERFKSGELFSGLIEVRAKALGMSGSDYLGECHLRSNNYFDHGPFERDVEEALESHDMIENALENLKETIQKRARELKEFA